MLQLCLGGFSAISLDRIGPQGSNRYVPNAPLPVRQARPPAANAPNTTQFVSLSREALQNPESGPSKLNVKLFADTSVPVGLALSQAAQDMSVKTYNFLKRMYPHLDAEAALVRGLRDFCPDSHDHCERVGDLALRLAREMDLDGDEASQLEKELEGSSDLKEAGFLALTISALDDAELEEFFDDAFTAGEFHDIGKLAIPSEILNKPSKLTEEEYDIVRLHPLIGETMLTPIDLPDTIRSAVRSHHERWDGQGYPDGLAGQEIPTTARILAIVDSFDAMTAGRPYRSRLSNQQAVEEIMRHAGTQFDPFWAEMFAQMIARDDSSVEF